MISRWQSCMLFLFLYQVAQRHECNATACLQGSSGTVFGRMGSQVILNCSGGQAANTRVLWKHNGMQVNRVSNESSIILNMTSLSLAGHYSCIDESTQRKLRDFQLCVGYPPDKPIVSCHSFNYPDAFRCQWQPQTTQLVSFTAKYRPLPREPEEECLIVNATTCMGTQTFLFSTTPVQLTVIASNEFGETSSTTYFILEDIVKPDPPRKVWARWRNFAHITWRAPISWSDEELYPLMYQVRYRGQHSSQWQLVEVADFNRNIKLKELLPWEDYFVQVSAKDFLDNGFWSAWSPTLKLKAKCAVVSFVNKYAPIGSNITIPCTLPEPTGKPSKEFRKPRVIWKLNGYRLRKSSAYSLKRRRLSIQHVKPSNEGRYTCHLQRDRFRVHLVKLLVGNPPAKLNISCHSNNYPESFRCQWQPPMTFLKNNYTTKLWNPSRNSFEECTLIGETTCEARNLTLFAVRPYRLVVTAKNALGYSQTNHSFFLEEIVQPNSPEQVTCRMKGNGNLQITWTKPKSWTSDPAFSLKYRLQFRQEEQQEWIEEHIPKKNTKSFVLRVPVISASYLVRLAARDQDTGHWSEWSSVAKVENM